MRDGDDEVPDQRTILICRCIHDIETKYFYSWLEPVIDEARRMGLNVIDLKGDDFNKEKFEDAIKEHDPFLVFGNGHGEENKIKGNNREVILEACNNDTLLEGRIAYFIGCKAAKILGPSAIDKGCSSFIGYDDVFLIMSDPKITMDGNPLDDIFVRGSMEASNQILLTLIKGGTPEEAVRNFQKTTNTWVEWWGSEEAYKTYGEFAPDIVGKLLRNKKIQKFLTGIINRNNSTS